MIRYIIFGFILLNIQSCTTFSLCNKNDQELGLNIDDLLVSKIITRNTQPSRENLFLLNNTDNWLDCVQLCCSDSNCNLAYFHGKNTCYLVKCVTSISCEPVHVTTFNDELIGSYLVKLRSYDDTAQKAVGLEKPIECNDKILDSCQANEKCLLNEKTDRFECKCEHDMKRINGVCRDYSKYSQSCEVFLNECGVNEECLPLNQRAKHGTCQCNIGYTRNHQMGLCLPVEKFAIIENEPIKEAETNILSIEQIDTTTTTILTKLISTAVKSEQTSSPSPQVVTTLGVSHLIANTNVKYTELPSESNKVDTNIIVDAGLEQNIPYPMRECVLNGTKSKTLDNSRIVKWEWSKSELSPALGNFVNINGTSTSSNPIALVENLVDGEYTFTLRVWTSRNLYNSNTVKINVHGAPSSNDDRYLNRVQMNINANPLKFIELEKYNFISKLELLLQQPKLFLKHPKIYITSIEESSNKQQMSTIRLEFYVINEADDDGTHTVVNSRTIMRLLYKLKYDYSKQYLDLTVNDILPMQCNQTACAKHGYCDPITFKCVCKKYWTPNLYKLYLNYESDETFGNNCDWNVVYVITGFSCSMLASLLITYYILKVVCYLLLCRCCKTSKQAIKDEVDIKTHRSASSCLRIVCCCCLGRSYFKKPKPETKYKLLEDMNDSVQFKGGKKLQQEHTYGLHSSDEENEHSFNKLGNGKDEEDVLYDFSKYNLNRRIGNNIV